MIRARGFSLVEVLVALVLGVGLTLAAATLHARVLALSVDGARAAEAQDTLRIALTVLEHELRHAGYWGLVPDASAIVGRADDAAPLGVAVANDCGPDWAIDLARPVQAFAGAWPLACAPTGGAAAGSGVLVLRRVSVREAAPEAAVVQLHSGHFSGHLAADGAAAADPEPELRDLMARAYYVSPRATGDAARPSLRRKTLQRGPRVVDEEVIAGISAMIVLLGVDADPPGVEGHGQPDRYVLPGAAAGRIVSVRVTLVSDGGFTATRTVWLRNGAV